jgi:ABC-type transporter Mla maintaining outer membrane lipid asymmetry permease subunit MlaE
MPLVGAGVVGSPAVGFGVGLAGVLEGYGVGEGGVAVGAAEPTAPEGAIELHAVSLLLTFL